MIDVCELQLRARSMYVRVRARSMYMPVLHACARTCLCVCVYICVCVRAFLYIYIYTFMYMCCVCVCNLNFCVLEVGDELTSLLDAVHTPQSCLVVCVPEQMRFCVQALTSVLLLTNVLSPPNGDIIKQACAAANASKET